MWVLMNADLVAYELRFVLTFEAMDVLLEDVVRASVEAKDLARLVSERPWRRRTTDVGGAAGRGDRDELCLGRGLMATTDQAGGGGASVTE